MSLQKISPYLNPNIDWKSYIERKEFILFDTDALISLISYSAYEDILGELSKSCGLCFFDPIEIELLNTKKTKERGLRSAILDAYFIKFPMRAEFLKHTKTIQLWMHGKQFDTAGVVDLYISSFLYSFAHNRIVLLTSNIRDFPYPLFRREAGIILQSNRESKVLSFLTLDHSQLSDFT